MSDNKSFSVLDMADSYAEANNIDPSEIFKKNPVSGKVKAEAESSDQENDGINKGFISVTDR